MPNILFILSDDQGAWAMHCAGTPELCTPHLDRLAREVAARAGRETVTCDSADPRLIAELRQRGIRAVGARKGPGSREHGYRFLQTLSRIVIDPARTPTVAKEFTSCEYETESAGRPLSAYPDRDDHTLDACRYALEKEMTPRKAKLF